MMSLIAKFVGNDRHTEVVLLRGRLAAVVFILHLSLLTAIVMRQAFELINSPINHVQLVLT